MERVSELFLRNVERFVGSDLLLINPPRDTFFRQLELRGHSARIFTQDFGDFTWLEAGGADVRYGLLPDSDPSPDHILMVLPRERERLRMMLHALATTMPECTPLWLAGENRSGIKSSAKYLGTHYANVNKMDSARHCVLLEASHPKPAGRFDLTAFETHRFLPAPRNEIEIISLPGTFAHGRLDPGTSLLLETLSELKPAGRVLDFACGSGVIGLCLLNKDPDITLTMLDTSALALESTRRSLLANSRQAIVLASDGLDEVTVKFDWIISNPPFHRGIANDLEITRKFLNEAGKRLEETGKILLVYNHHLPYGTWLKENFKRVETVKANREFKVVLASEVR